MRPPSASGAGGGARCSRCGGAVVLCEKHIVCAKMNEIAMLEKIWRQHTPPIHQVAGALPKGPWTGRGTKVRTPDDDNCQSTAHTTRPSMSLKEKWGEPFITSIKWRCRSADLLWHVCFTRTVCRAVAAAADTATWGIWHGF